MTDLFSAIKAELDKYEGCWMLPDDLDDLAELCENACRRVLGGEWVRVAQPVEYEVADG